MGIVFGTRGLASLNVAHAKGAIRGISAAPMTLFSRYMFRQVANAFIVILLTLTIVVWLATALKELNLITSRGQGILLFLQMTLLSLPSLMALIAPNAMLMASLYTLDRMNGDSELIVMTSSGAPIWRIGAPLLALASLVSIGILLANLFLTPASMRALRDFVTQVRADLISQVLQPGRFSSPESGLTFHIRDRSLNGDLLGLLVHDERDDKQVMSYLAERGRIITNDEGSYLVMFDGYVHRYNGGGQRQERADRGLRPEHARSFRVRPEGQCRQGRSAARDVYQRPHQPRHERQGDQRGYGQIRAELHDRLATPLYPLVFAFIAIALLGHARTTRESRWGADSHGVRHRRWASGCRAHRRQPGGPQCVGCSACVCYSARGDSRCGMGGAR